MSVQGGSLAITGPAGCYSWQLPSLSVSFCGRCHDLRLGPRAVGWPSNEIEALNAARISGKTDTQIRELVETLHTKRKELMAAWGL